jgi:tripartite-type tricarboxylate transporter receptor subunit TctC
MEFVAFSKAHPGKLDYAATGVGSSPHLSFELFKSMTGAKVLFVPYKSGALAQNDLAAGRITSQMTNLPNHIENVRTGKVRALGVTSLRRSARLPQVPSLHEAGVRGFDVSSWYGVCAPIGVDAEVQKKIEVDVLRVLAMPVIRQRLTDMGVDVEPLDAAAFRKFFEQETTRWVKAARDAGIKPQ